MRWTGQFQACLFFFWRKDFARTKTRHKQKSTNKTKNKLTLNNKGNNFSRAHKLPRCDVFLCVQNLFVKKKNKQAWNCLINLIILYYYQGKLRFLALFFFHLLLAKSLIYLQALPSRHTDQKCTYKRCL